MAMALLRCKMERLLALRDMGNGNQVGFVSKVCMLPANVKERVHRSRQRSA